MFILFRNNVLLGNQEKYIRIFHISRCALLYQLTFIEKRQTIYYLRDNFYAD